MDMNSIFPKCSTERSFKDRCYFYYAYIMRLQKVRYDGKSQIIPNSLKYPLTEYFVDTFNFKHLIDVDNQQYFRIALTAYLRQTKYSNNNFINHVADLSPEILVSALRNSEIGFDEKRWNFHCIEQLGEKGSNEILLYLKNVKAIQVKQSELKNAIIPHCEKLHKLHPIELLTFIGLFLQYFFNGDRKRVQIDGARVFAGLSLMLKTYKLHTRECLETAGEIATIIRESEARYSVYQGEDFYKMINIFIYKDFYEDAIMNNFSFDLRYKLCDDLIMRSSERNKHDNERFNKKLNLNENYWYFCDQYHDRGKRFYEEIQKIGRENFSKSLFGNIGFFYLFYNFGIDSQTAINGTSIRVFDLLHLISDKKSQIAQAMQYSKDYIVCRPHRETIEYSMLAFFDHAAEEVVQSLPKCEKLAVAKVIESQKIFTTQENPEKVLKRIQSVGHRNKKRFLVEDEVFKACTKKAETAIEAFSFSEKNYSLETALYFKYGEYLISFPQYFARYFTAHGTAQNLLRLNTDSENRKRWSDSLEERVSSWFHSRKFSTIHSKELPSGVEVDVIAYQDGHLFLLELKSTFIRLNIKHEYEYYTNSLLKAERQLEIRREWIVQNKELFKSWALDYGVSIDRDDFDIHLLIVDNTFENDGELFEQALKISILELHVAIYGFANVLFDFAPYFDKILRGESTGSEDPLSPNKYLYRDKPFSVERFIEIIEKRTVWEPLDEVESYSKPLNEFNINHPIPL